jgi:glutathione S-transferase
MRRRASPRPKKVTVAMSIRGFAVRLDAKATKETTMKLYNAALSPNGKRVRICAAELGLALDEATIDFARGDARTPEYLALNPMGKVPTLTDGPFVLWESAAILFYLAAERGPSALWPADARAQADTMRWLFFCSCHVDPYFTTLVVERFIKPRRELPTDEAQVAHATESLARFVPVLERQLVAREFVAGRFGLGDIALACTIELAPSLGYDLSPYEQVRAWLARCQSRPSWKALG